MLVHHLREGMDGCAWVPQDLQADTEQQRVLKGAAWANKHVREARAEMQEQCAEQEHVTKRATKVGHADRVSMSGAGGGRKRKAFGITQ